MGREAQSRESYSELAVLYLERQEEAEEALPLNS